MRMTHDRLLGWVGHRVDDVNGARVGRVEAILVDRERGTPQWLLLRLPQRHGFLAAPLLDLVVGAGHLHLPLPRAQLLAAPRVPESGRLSARQERLLCDVYRLKTRTRGALLGDWERRATSARLVAPDRWEPEPRGPSPIPAGVGGTRASAPSRHAATPTPATASPALTPAPRRAVPAPAPVASAPPVIPAPPAVLPRAVRRTALPFPAGRMAPNDDERDAPAVGMLAGGSPVASVRALAPRPVLSTRGAPSGSPPPVRPR